MATKKLTKRKTARRASTTHWRTTTPSDPRHPLHAAWAQTFEDERNATLMHSIVEAGASGAIWIGRNVMRGIEIVTGVITTITAWIVSGMSQDDGPQSDVRKRNSPPSSNRIALREMGRNVPPHAQDMSGAGHERWLEVVGDEKIVRYGEVIQPTRPIKTKRENSVAYVFGYKDQMIIVPNSK